MARPLWKGYVSFGLVSVPCTLATMEAPEKDIDFTMLDRRDRARIRYQRINEHTGKEVPWKEIVKGHEVAEGEYVVVTPDDLKRAAPKATRTIEIVGFVPGSQVPPWFYERPYVVQPLEGGEKGYRLLSEALEQSKEVGIARVVLHTRQHLAALISTGDALILNTMRFDAELRQLKDFDIAPSSEAPAKASKREVDMALTLIKSMSMDWSPSQFHDEYRDTLRKWIAQQAKKGGQPAAEAEEEEEAPATYNIMEMLKKSIEGQKKTGGQPKKRAASRRKAG